MKLGVYIRVSTSDQREDSQRHELEKWLTSQAIEGARWFTDVRTGDNLDRPGFEALQQAVFAGEVDCVVCWRLDRLSRSLRDGVNLIHDWLERGVRLIAVRQQLDLGGATGRMLAAVLFSLAEIEQQTRRERQAAGIAAARASGLRWRGRKPGAVSRTTKAREDAVRALYASRRSVREIARLVDLDRATVKAILGRSGESYTTAK